MEQTKGGEALTDCYFRNCMQECEEPIKGEIKGSIPTWVHGSLVRNGPGLTQIGENKYNHVFDGPAFLQKFAIADGQVTYQNRFLRTVTYNSNMKAQRITVSEFGTLATPDPCNSLFKRLKAWFTPSELTDNTCVTIMPYGNEIYAMTEVPKINQVDLPTLDVVKQRDLNKNFSLELKTITAHAHVDADGTVYNVGATMDSSGPAHRIIKIPIAQDGSGAPDFEGTTVVATVKGQYRFKCSYMHSFAMTENYFVFLEQPMYMSIPKLILGSFTGRTAFSDSLYFEKDNRTRFHVIRRSDGQEIPLIYESNSFMTFHHVNAYEQDGCIVVDICGYKDAEIIKALGFENMRKGTENPAEFFNKINSDIRRYVLPLEKPKDKEIKAPLEHTSATAQGTDEDKIFCEPDILYSGSSFVELPTINYNAHNGKKYRYSYFTETTNDGKQQLVKLDADTKSVLKWAEPRMIPTEPIMAQHPNAKSEDEGVVLCVVLNADNENCVTLLALDSKSFQELGRADFDLPSAAPAGFHGLLFN